MAFKTFVEELEMFGLLPMGFRDSAFMKRNTNIIYENYCNYIENRRTWPKISDNDLFREISKHSKKKASTSGHQLDSSIESIRHITECIKSASFSGFDEYGALYVPLGDNDYSLSLSINNMEVPQFKFHFNIFPYHLAAGKVIVQFRPFLFDTLSAHEKIEWNRMVDVINKEMDKQKSKMRRPKSAFF